MGLAPIRFTRQGRAMVLWLLEAAGGIEMSDTLPLPERLSDVDWLRARAAASLISASAWGPEAEWCSFSERDLTDAERYNRIADALAGAAARTAALEAALAELLRTRRLHVHRGLCPDDVQPNSLDPDCEACRAIASAGVLVSRPNAQHSAQRQSGEAATQTVGPDDEADIATIAYMHGAAHANDRVREVEAENKRLREALTELVACKSLKDRLDRPSIAALDSGTLPALRREYERRNPIAWRAAIDAARAEQDGTNG